MPESSDKSQLPKIIFGKKKTEMIPARMTYLVVSAKFVLRVIIICLI